MMHKFLFFIILCCASLPVCADQDQDFLEAYDAFDAGNQAKLADYANKLKNYVLEPYVAYWQIKLRIEDTSPAEVRNVISHYSDTPVAGLLLTDWLKSLGKRQQWDLFNQEYVKSSNDDIELTCYGFQGRIYRNDPEVLREARPLWFSGQDLSEGCTPVFNALFKEELLDEEDTWQRIRLALESGNTGVARRVNEYLPAKQKLDLGVLDKITRNSNRFLEKRVFNFKTRGGRELVVYAINRTARTAPLIAYQHWSNIKENFSDADQKYMMGRLAYYAASQLLPEADTWYEWVNLKSLNDTQLEWKVRSALRADNWLHVISAINHMSPSKQQQANWRYWKAVAFIEQGNISDAQPLLVPLSREHNFYGQLAREELGTPLEIPMGTYQPSPEEIDDLLKNATIKRALAFYRLNLRTEGMKEWALATRNFNDRQLLAAAELARRYQLYDRAINAAEQTVQLHDFNLKYLAPYREFLQERVNKLGLDEAWVYGLIRQESRFIMDARSNAGASGLMQIMPATAKWLAKQIGIKRYSKTEITSLNTNITFGTYYLKQLLNSMDNHPVLASAAYNAGPIRAQSWRSRKPIEGAIYAETIPFSETRDYVKKVMNNTMYYARQFGQHAISLKERLGVIYPRGQTAE
jgi:soluble lytic murein transglycosylase